MYTPVPDVGVAVDGGVGDVDVVAVGPPAFDVDDALEGDDVDVAPIEVALGTLVCGVEDGEADFVRAEAPLVVALFTEDIVLIDAAPTVTEEIGSACVTPPSAIYNAKIAESVEISRRVPVVSRRPNTPDSKRRHIVTRPSSI